jgi:hypothetical protein
VSTSATVTLLGNGFLTRTDKLCQNTNNIGTQRGNKSTLAYLRKQQPAFGYSVHPVQEMDTEHGKGDCEKWYNLRWASSDPRTDKLCRLG